MKRVTCWYKENKYNHLSDGWEQGKFPKLKHASQKTSWTSGNWKAKYGVQIGLKVIQFPSVIQNILTR